MNQFRRVILQSSLVKYKRGLPFSCYRIQDHRTNLGDEAISEAEIVTLAINEPN